MDRFIKKNPVKFSLAKFQSHNEIINSSDNSSATQNSHINLLDKLIVQTQSSVGASGLLLDAHSVNDYLSTYQLVQSALCSPSSPHGPYGHLLASTVLSEKKSSNENAHSSSKYIPSAVIERMVRHRANQARIKIPNCPNRVLDAPGYLDDFYLKLIDWGPSNILAVALGPALYLWNPENGLVHELLSVEQSTRSSPRLMPYIASVQWLPDASLTNPILALGTSDGSIQLWNVNTEKKLRTLSHHKNDSQLRHNSSLHPQRIGALAWNRHILSSGNRAGVLYHSDVRMAAHYTNRIEKLHSQEICGLSWSSDGVQLASGGNDNLLQIIESGRTVPLYKLTKHKAAVKSLAWCQSSARLLASGGGTADQTICTWNTTTGKCLTQTDCHSQVTSLLWSKNNHLISSHGFSENQIALWRYPSMRKAGELKGHSGRVLAMAKSADGCTIVSAGADESLNFWDILSPPKKKIEKSKIIENERLRSIQGNLSQQSPASIRNIQVNEHVTFSSPLILLKSPIRIPLSPLSPGSHRSNSMPYSHGLLSTTRL